MAIREPGCGRHSHGRKRRIPRAGAARPRPFWSWHDWAGGSSRNSTGARDIEWAWAAGRLYLLQARAITSPLPAGMSSRPLRVMWSINHVQGMLDPFTPLSGLFIEAFLAITRLAGGGITTSEPARRAYRCRAHLCRTYAGVAPRPGAPAGGPRPWRHRTRVRGGAVQRAGQPDLLPDRQGFSPAALRTLAGFWSVLARRIVERSATRRASAGRFYGQFDAFIAEHDGAGRGDHNAGAAAGAVAFALR